MRTRGFVGFSVIANLGVLGEFWTAVLAVCRIVGLAIVASRFFFLCKKFRKDRLFF